MKIQAHRGNTATVQLPLNLSKFTKVMMGEHSLVFSFSSPVQLDVQVGDTLTYKGELMTVNQAPIWTRSHIYQYEIRFEGQRHSLERWLLMDEGALTFDYFGSLEEYMYMFLERLNSVDSGWTADIDSELDPVAISFDEVDCYSALNDIAEAFGCEWDIVGKVITVKKTIGRATSLEFAYGKGNGLYELTRKRIDNSKIVTRAYATGGSQNLPLGYAKRKLTLDGYLEDAAAITAYGLREGVVNDEEVFPSRTGTATAVGQINEGTFSLTDTAIDFDLEGQRIDGTEAMIVFQSGALSGQQFKILSYNHTTKQIRYEANKDSNGGLMPLGNIVAEVGDYYTLIGIRMPESYVTAALGKLEEKREEYLLSNKDPRVLYGLNIDILNLRRLNTEPQTGDIIRVIDTDNAIDAEIRVTSVTYPGHFPDVLEQGMQFTAEIGNEVTYTRVEKIEKDVKENKEITTQYSRESWERDRRNIVALQEFMGKVFDPDGNLQEPLIKAIVGFFGTESMIYDLEDVTYVVNPGGDENAFSISSGELIHKVYKIDGLGYIWDISALAVDGLDPLKSYYLSAKCSQTALTGKWVLTESQMPVDAEVGYWYFNLGVLSSVIDGARSLQSTMGYTMISGGEIITDSITAFRINVRKLFSQYIEAENFWLKIGKIGIFDVADGHIRTENWNNASNDEGIRFTNNGILSRNANEQLFPATSGLNYAGSLVGMVDKPLPSEQDSFGSYARAGQMGINYRDMTVKAQNQLMWTWGQYGGLFSSLKVLGGVELPARIEEGTGIVQIDGGDFHVIIAGQHTGAQLPSAPNHGQMIVIKNSRAIDITITAGSGHNFIFGDNSQSGTATIPGGRYRWYQFVRQLFTGGHWVEIGTIGGAAGGETQKVRYIESASISAGMLVGTYKYLNFQNGSFTGITDN